MGALVLAFLVPTAGRAQNAAKAPGGGPQPKIEVLSMAYDFGDVYHQEKYVHAFVVRNRGDADLIIKEVNPG